MISIHKGEYFYSDGIGVSNINLDIKEGESACIMGPMALVSLPCLKY